MAAKNHPNRKNAKQVKLKDSKSEAQAQRIQEGGYRRSLRRNRRLVVALALVLVLVYLALVVWQAVDTNTMKAQYPPPGNLVEVSGVDSGEDAQKPHKLHLYCLGQGQPTVILESGVPEWSLHWRPVQEEVAKFTRVCAYDRAGYGWSEPGPKPRSAGQIVGELHALLSNAKEKGPFLFVAHSIWGPAVLLYQHNYPDQVSGIILADSWSPGMFSTTSKLIEQSAKLTESMGSIAPVGLLRLGKQMNLLPLDAILRTDLLPPDLRPEADAFALQPGLWNTMSAEYKAMGTSAEQLKGLGKLGNLPLVVIQAGRHDPGFYVSETDWAKIQQELADLSTDSQLVVAETSGHVIQLQQPEIVVETIREMAGSVRK